jgi:DNA repair protein RadC
VLRPYFFGLEVENFMVVTMNRKNKILNVHNVSKGGISNTTADPKVIFDKAIRDKASSIILAHNHPSGNVVPSDSDDGLMRKIKAGGQLLDISVLDSIIIGRDESYYSYADEGRF